MTRHSSISLSEHDTDFIEEQIGNGTYKSATDVVSAGLRLLEEHDAKVKALQAALKAGEESGPAVPFDRDGFLSELHSRHAQQKN